MMSITLDQLVAILGPADTVISLGHGRGRVQYADEYPEDTTVQEDMDAFRIKDDEDDVEHAFSYRNLLEGRISDDGELLIAKDNDGHEHWMKFLEHKPLCLKAICDEVAAVEARGIAFFGGTE